MKVPVGLDRDTGKPVLISDLPEGSNGLACNCVCPNPECNDLLVARFYKGTTTNHFAHKGKTATSKCSAYGLHSTAEAILMKQTWLPAPGFPLLPERQHRDSFGIPLLLEKAHALGEKAGFPISEALTEVSITGASDEALIRGDVVCQSKYRDVPFRLNLEVKVTHEVDPEKLIKLQRIDITTIEIDLSDLHTKPWTEDSVEKAVLSRSRMTLLHVCKSLRDALLAPVSAERERLISDREATVGKNFESLVDGIVGKPLPLPDYEIPEEGDDAWRHLLRTRASDLNRVFRQLKTPTVKAVEHLGKNELQLVFETTPSLPVFIESASQEQARGLQSYLILGQGALLASLPPSFIWGRNQKLDAKKKKFKQQANSDWQRFQQSIFDRRETFKERQISATHSNSRHFKKAHDDFIFSYEYLNRGCGIDAHILDSMISESDDEYRIFDVPPNIWQTICIAYQLDQNFPRYSDVLRYLKTIGLRFSYAYRSQMESLDLPDPYETFSSYLWSSRVALRAYRFDDPRKSHSWLAD
ncbi:hypothetical protein [Alteromonas antoniana]|uniref:hypothetical protein n=1 Tax=Alteromonas antoniana TaxID=2803813 RepID=UPI001C48C4BF|nr:hypothetical protein [Alteromonas antoniana]